MSIEERIEILRIFAELEDFDFIKDMSSEQLWKLMFMASLVLDVGKERSNKDELEYILEQLKHEIKEMTPTYHMYHNPDCSITDLVPISEVLKHIDKYKAESEDK